MIAFISLLAFELLRNWYVIAKLKQSPNDARGWAFRALVILFAAFIQFDLELSSVVIFGGRVVAPVTTLVYCLGCGLAFWFPFDLGLNILRGKAWNYLGKTAVLDRFNLPGDLEWVVKFVLMLVGIWLILL